MKVPPRELVIVPELVMWLLLTKVTPEPIVTNSPELIVKVDTVQVSTFHIPDIGDDSHDD